MDILIFCIGFVIFVTYMFFLLRMINKSHKSQERAQGKYKRQIHVTKNSKRQIHVTKNRGSMGAGNYYTEQEKRKQFPYSKR